VGLDGPGLGVLGLKDQALARGNLGHRRLVRTKPTGCARPADT
jgi:hypothetical protein